MKLLVIEDDDSMLKYLKKGLVEQGFTVDVYADGHAGLEAAMAAEHDLIVLDVTLPGIDGWTVLSTMRENLRTTPVVMLTAQDAAHYRVQGLSMGAAIGHPRLRGSLARRPPVSPSTSP